VSSDSEYTRTRSAAWRLGDSGRRVPLRWSRIALVRFVCRSVPHWRSRYQLVPTNHWSRVGTSRGRAQQSLVDNRLLAVIRGSAIKVEPESHAARWTLTSLSIDVAGDRNLQSIGQLPSIARIGSRPQRDCVRAQVPSLFFHLR